MNPNAPAQFRLFIAVTVPEEVKSAIEKAQAELRRVAPEGPARWTTRAQFHLTLKFLGNVEVERVQQLQGAVGAACRDFAALQLRAERIGFFPDQRFPRVVWVGIHDQQQNLPRLQSAIETAVRDFTPEEPEGRFSGHITLGRIKGIKRPEAEKLASVASAMAERLFGEWTAHEVEIIRSELSSQGARYTTLARIVLPK